MRSDLAASVHLTMKSVLIFAARGYNPLLLMKSLAAISFFAFVAGITSAALGQGNEEHALSLTQPDNYTTANTGIGSNSKNSSGAAASSTPDETNVDGDDSIYRGSTRETENQMMRDEGPIHFKPRPREKAQEVDSKNLHTSGVDPKFQGSLLHSSLTSINDVGDKVSERAADKGDQKPAIPEPRDPRFRTRQLIFTPQGSDESKNKVNKADASADSSPSPSPSPSASASPDQSKR
jgi:hypothetical protein